VAVLPAVKSVVLNFNWGEFIAFAVILFFLLLYCDVEGKDRFRPITIRQPPLVVLGQ
jgi:hypothetical protein